MNATLITDVIDNAAVENAIRGRCRQIKGLRRLKRRLARNSALQALQVQRHIDYLQRLNDSRRGPSNAAFSRPEGTTGSRLWF